MRRSLLLLIVAVFSIAAGPQPDLAQRVPGGGRRNFEMAVPKIETAMSPSTARRGQTASWQLTVELAPGWHTYPTHQSDPKAEDYVS